MIPGIQPRIVKQMLMRKSAPHPRSRKTPRGGRIKAKMSLQISLEAMCQYSNFEECGRVTATLAVRQRFRDHRRQVGRAAKQKTYEAVKGIVTGKSTRSAQTKRVFGK